MVQTINEPIKVGVRFSNDRTIDLDWFGWRGRKYDVDSIREYDRIFEGEAPLHHFAVRAGDQFFKLVFNGKKLQWQLEKVWTERD